MNDESVFKSNIAGINYWYGRHDDEQIPENHKQLLSEHAQEDIGKWISDGWVCGTLSDMLVDDGNNEIKYDGWWGGK